MREVGRIINLFGVVFKKIQQVKVWSKICFLNKTEKKTFWAEYVFEKGRHTRGFALPLKHVEAELDL